jgi:hypothetical protein
MESATRVEGDKEGDGFGGKSNGNKDGRQATATRAMARVMDDVGDGSKQGNGMIGKSDSDGGKGGG